MTTERVLMTGEQRAESILCAAVVLADRVGLNNLTRDAIAAEAGCAAGLVNTRLGPMPDVINAVVRRAVRDEKLAIIAQACAMGNAVVQAEASTELKTKALLSQVKG